MQLLGKGNVLNPGKAQGALLVLEDALSFWGGFDPQTGRILDDHHPQKGASIRGRVLAMPHSKGSAGTPAGMAESIRKGVGPVAILLRKADVNVTIGAMVAARLYDLHIPVLQVPDPLFAQLVTGQVIAIDPSGHISALDGGTSVIGL
ncbi:DUF126 domain-containing protein [Ruegeria sp.]|uniref:aconitase X swivel domain-containing protein n=1 Tax=Ruegeria sp. TaxID=1879320 RepID=UPI00230D7A59|nr:DUF126 domain-containing protein [Ruegeria sp.]MDA7965536.1 DUF126 domain-containing protein [Ruegeria sp.]